MFQRPQAQPRAGNAMQQYDHFSAVLHPPYSAAKLPNWAPWRRA